MYRMILAHDIKISNMIVSAFKKSNLRKYKDFILKNMYLLIYENSFGAKMIIALF